FNLVIGVHLSAARLYRQGRVKVNRFAAIKLTPRRIRTVGSYSVSLRLNVPMNPHAVHQAQSKHDHQHKTAAVTDQRQWYTGDWQHRDRHSHVLENVREYQRGDAHHEQKSQLVSGEKGNEKTR